MRPRFGVLFEGTSYEETIPAYFWMLMCAFIACTWVGTRWARREGRDYDVIVDLALISLITGVIGARIAHVLFDGFFMDYVHMCTDPSQVGWTMTIEQCQLAEARWDEAANLCRPIEGDCFAWVKFWHGGLTWYGGMIAGVAYAMVFLKKERFPRIKALDFGGMVLPIGLFFGRLGCFFGGCCFGQPTDSWFGVSFPEWSSASEAQWREHLLAHPSEPSLPVIPTQLFEAAGCLALAFVMIAVVQPNKRFDGQTFCISMIGYAALRFVLEFMRADDRGGLLGLTTSQWIGVVIALAVAAVWPVFQRIAREVEQRGAAQSPEKVGAS